MPATAQTTRLCSPWILIALLALTGCGVGGDGAVTSPATVAAQIVFPPPVSMTTMDQITVRGTATGGEAIAAIRVNGVAATSPDRFQTFRATVALALANNDIRVDIQMADGSVDTDAATAKIERVAVSLANAQSVDYDPVADETYVFDGHEGLLRYAHATATWSLVSSEANQTGSIAQGGAFDASTKRYYQAYRGKIDCIDTATGTRTSLTGGSGPITIPDDMDVDQAGSAYVIGYAQPQSVFDPAFDGLLRIDLATGESTVVSSDTVGTGPAFGSLRHISVEPQGSVAYVYCTSPKTLFEVDLATGNRTRMMGEGSTTGFLPTHTRGMVVDPAARMAYLAESDAVHQLDWSNDTATEVFDRRSDAPLGLGSIRDIAAGPAGTLRIADTSFRNAGWAGLSTLELGSNTLTNHYDTQVGTGDIAPLAGLVDLVVEPGTSRLVVLSGTQLTSLDLETGARVVFSDDATASGPEIDGADALVVGSDGMAYVGNRDEILAVDMASGERRLVSDDGAVGAGPPFASYGGLSWDPNAGALVGGDDDDLLMRVDTSGGNRVSFTNEYLYDLYDIDLDAKRNRLYLATETDDDGYLIRAADLATGVVSPLLYTNAAGVGSVETLASDPVTGRLYAISDACVHEVDAASGTPREVADMNDAAKGPTTYFRPVALAAGGLDGIVFVGASGHIFAVDAETGERVVIAR